MKSDKGLYGSIETHSLGVSFPSFYRKDCNDIFLKYSNGKTIEFDKYNWNEAPESDLNFFLTDRHEFDHFHQLAASPFGVLIFRIYNVLTRDVWWLGKEFDKLGLKVDNSGQNLVDWLELEGVKRYISRVSLTPNGERDIKYMAYEFLPGFRSVDKLLRLISAKTVPVEFKNITVKEFCNLLNTSYQYMRRRCDVDIEYPYGVKEDWIDKGFIWETKLPPETKLFPEGAYFFSFYNILELLAYFNELLFLEKCNVNNKVLEDFFIKRFPKEYYHQYQLYNKIFKNSSYSRGHLSSYLDMRIDLTSGSTTEKKTIHYIEEEWPFFMVDNFYKSKDFHDKRILHIVKGLQSMVDRKKLFGENSKWREFVGSFPRAANFNSHVLKLEKTYFIGLERKLKNRIAEVNGKLETFNLNDIEHQIEYKDHISFSPSEFKINFTQEEYHNYLLAHISSVLHPFVITIFSKILNGYPVPSTKSIINKVHKGLELHFSLIEGKAISMPELKQFVSEFFTEDQIEKYFPGIKINWYTPVL